jgi:hypothetical protein
VYALQCSLQLDVSRDAVAHQAEQDVVHQVGRSLETGESIVPNIGPLRAPSTDTLAGTQARIARIILARTFFAWRAAAGGRFSISAGRDIGLADETQQAKKPRILP